MSNLLQTGSDWLEMMRTNHLASPITYRRGQDSAVQNATLGRSEYEATDESGFKVTAFVNDFLIIADDLVLAGVKVLPKISDQITLSRSGISVTFEVMALPSGEYWRYSDPFGKTLRIHTKQVS